MTNPPPPGNWGPPQPPYGQGQPPYGSGPWPPQQGWGPPPQPPKNNSLKWLLIGVAVLLVIAISVGATLLFTRDGGGGTTQTANGNPPAAGEIASANDTGPVSIITEDPTCDPWRPIATTLANVERQGWTNRDDSIPSEQWTSEIRAQHEAVAAAMREAADQSVRLARLTPHRVMRELYEQSIAYWRAYAESVPNYQPLDNHLANAAGNASNAVVSICNAIGSRTAQSRGPLVERSNSPSSASAASNPDTAKMFITESNASACADWEALTDKFDAETSQWRESNHQLSANEWNPVQQAVVEQTSVKINAFAEGLVSLAGTTDNSTWQDFAELSSQYWRAYVASIPTYSGADHVLSVAAAYLAYIPLQGCLAVRS